jgi:hypothetical protein
MSVAKLQSRVRAAFGHPMFRELLKIVTKADQNDPRALAGWLGPSFRLAALVTYEETATRQVRMVRWRDPAVETAQIAARKGPKQGVIDRTISRRGLDLGGHKARWPR